MVVEKLGYFHLQLSSGEPQEVCLGALLVSQQGVAQSVCYSVLFTSHITLAEANLKLQMKFLCVDCNLAVYTLMSQHSIEFKKSCRFCQTIFSR